MSEAMAEHLADEWLVAMLLGNGEEVSGCGERAATTMVNDELWLLLEYCGVYARRALWHSWYLLAVC